MKHTYLFEPASWQAKGTYYDADLNSVEVLGWTNITHTDDFWINDGSMRLLNSEAEFFNRYEIKPFEQGKDFTDWASYNPALGQIDGNFMLVEDSILSRYASKDGRYSGFEFLKKIDDYTYENRGFAFDGNKKLSSWSVKLSRIK